MPVSLGELLDKISILEIKLVRISDVIKLDNVRLELLKLHQVLEQVDLRTPHDLRPLIAELRLVNEKLWDVEEAIREHEKDHAFGHDFVGLARLVYKTNDKRSFLKKQINILSGSELVEEKSYSSY